MSYGLGEHMPSSLTAEELFQLGLHATKHADSHTAIGYLAQSCELEPSNAKATYLLGAVYAQVGLYDRARDFLHKAIELDPQEYTGIYQLGLLYLTSGNVENARLIWQQLDALGSENYLYLFKAAMLALVEDDFAHCILLIDQGIERNQQNENLNEDMRKVRAATETAVGNGINNGETSDGPRVNHLVLSGYQQAQNK
jgi:Flp pilus assembly protein TadD